ncbi:MAG: hypothetical protein KAS32_00590 [Candidatus Peribacteraceae bacterium]|nr:hypothetical protein [Candidatus Peribacteraceae bacterium]
MSRQDLMTFLAESCDCAKVTHDLKTNHILIRVPENCARFVKTGLEQLVPIGVGFFTEVRTIENWERDIWIASGEDLFIYEEGECKE